MKMVSHYPAHVACLGTRVYVTRTTWLASQLSSSATNYVLTYVKLPVLSALLPKAAVV